MTVAVAAAAVLIVSTGCAVLGDEPTALQDVDWRNGPFAPPCAGTINYVDGVAEREGGSTRLSLVGYSDLDGRPGDEAVLQHTCPADSQALSIWRGLADEPELVGVVEPPSGLADVRGWVVDRGVLCVVFNVGDGGVDPQAQAVPVLVRSGGAVVWQEGICDAGLDLSEMPE